MEDETRQLGDVCPCRGAGRGEDEAAPQLYIKALPPNPDGYDPGNEWVEFVNDSPHDLALDGWRLSSDAGAAKSLAGSIPAGKSLRITLDDGFVLKNTGMTVRLISPGGRVVQDLRYAQNEAESGRVVEATPSAVVVGESPAKTTARPGH